MIWLLAFRQRIVTYILACAVVLGTLGVGLTLYTNIQSGFHWTFTLGYYLGAYLVCCGLLLARRMPTPWRAGGLLALLYIFACLTFVTGWLGGGGRVFLLGLVLLATILIGPRSGVFTALLSMLTYAVFGMAFARGWLVYPYAPLFAERYVILIEGIGFAIALGISGIVLWFFREGLKAASQALEQTQTARAELAERARELDEANQLLAERSTSLENANRELEAFSFSVSHDLRAPLRAIDSFANLLSEDHLDQLDSTGQSYLKRIRHNASRMNRLIDDLLAFSRLSRQPLNIQAVDLASLVEQVIAEQRQAYPALTFNVRLDSLPACQADPPMLRQVYENLVGNAFKYSSKRAQPQIEVGSLETADQTVYYVRDNGAGFDMAYASKLFGVFQRLHTTNEFEGNGVGLANVQRIIDRHGGQIWAEAAVDQGATFYFTLRPGQGV